MLKHLLLFKIYKICLITVQDNTMLKPLPASIVAVRCLITVQDNTMLKRNNLHERHRYSLITVQDNTMLKHVYCSADTDYSLITVQDNTMLKPQIQASLRTTRRNPKRYFLLSYFYYITSFVLTQLFRIDPDL